MATWTIIIGLVVLAAAIWGLGAALGRERVSERIHCRERGEDLDVTFERRLDSRWNPSARVDVSECSAFEDPEHVECEKGCLHESGRARAETLVPTH